MAEGPVPPFTTVKLPLIDGRYECLALLGAGGFASVFLALDHGLDRNVAVKVLSSSHFEDLAVIDRCRREFMACSAISHPNVIKAYDFIHKEGVVALILEYLEAEPLSDIYGKGQMSQDGAVDIIVQIADALKCLHEHGILHRDIKPDNIMVEPGGRAILMDLNLAFDYEMTALTETGVVVGTPSYLAPELMLGAAYSEASDVYALGLVLWRLLTGTEPYEDGASLSTIMKVASEGVPPVEELVPGVDASLARIVARSVEIDPSLRIPSAGHLLRELRRFRQGRSRARSASGASGLTAKEPVAPGRASCEAEDTGDNPPCDVSTSRAGATGSGRAKGDDTAKETAGRGETSGDRRIRVARRLFNTFVLGAFIVSLSLVVVRLYPVYIAGGRGLPAMRGPSSSAVAIRASGADRRGAAAAPCPGSDADDGGGLSAGASRTTTAGLLSLYTSLKTKRVLDRAGELAEKMVGHPSVSGFGLSQDDLALLREGPVKMEELFLDDGIEPGGALDCYNALVDLWRLNPVFECIGLEPPVAWSPSESALVRVRLIGGLPWAWASDQWPGIVLRRRLARKTMGLRPRCPTRYAESNIPFILAGTHLEHERVQRFRITRRFLDSCSAGRASLFLALSERCPQAGCIVDVNDRLNIPCWQLYRTDGAKSTFYFIEFPSSVLVPGLNEITVSMHSALPKHAFEYGAWKSMALFPGITRGWLRSFQAGSDGFLEKASSAVPEGASSGGAGGSPERENRSDHRVSGAGGDGGSAVAGAGPFWFRRLSAALDRMKQRSVSGRMVKPSRSGSKADAIRRSPEPGGALEHLLKLAKSGMKGNVLRRHLIESDSELERLLPGLGEKCMRFFNGAVPLHEKLELVALLTELRKYEALVVHHGGRPLLRWRLASDRFVRLRYCCSNSYFPPSRKNPGVRWARYYRTNPLGDGLSTRRPDSFSTGLYSLLSGGKKVRTRLEKTISLGRDWLRACRGGRATLVISVVSACPGTGFILSVNRSLVLPLWELGRTSQVSRRTYLIEFPSVLLHPGDNILALSIDSVLGDGKTSFGALRQYLLLPGPAQGWRCLGRLEPVDDLETYLKKTYRRHR